MPVYVDDMMAPFGRMKMNHLFADTPEELFEMVDKIGVQRKWYQNTSIPHFDIAAGKRLLAIDHGAIQLVYGTNDEFIELTRRLREQYQLQESREPFLRMMKEKPNVKQTT